MTPYDQIETLKILYIGEKTAARKRFILNGGSEEFIKKIRQIDLLRVWPWVDHEELGNELKRDVSVMPPKLQEYAKSVILEATNMAYLEDGEVCSVCGWKKLYYECGVCWHHTQAYIGKSRDYSIKKQVRLKFPRIRTHGHHMKRMRVIEDEITKLLSGVMQPWWLRNRHYSKDVPKELVRSLRWLRQKSLTNGSAKVL